MIDVIMIHGAAVPCTSTGVSLGEGVVMAISTQAVVATVEMAELDGACHDITCSNHRQLPQV